MKKILTAALAMVMTLTMGMTALAAPSTSATDTANTVSGATDKNGNKVEATVNDNVDTTIVTKASNELKTVLGSAYKDTMKVKWVKDISVPEGTVFPVTITFKVDGVKANSTVFVMHYNGTAWEKISAKAGDGTVTATFTSLSPVAVVVDTATAAAPKTADNGVAAAGLIAIFAVAGIAVVGRRKVQA